MRRFVIAGLNSVTACLTFTVALILSAPNFPAPDKIRRAAAKKRAPSRQMPPRRAASNRP